MTSGLKILQIARLTSFEQRTVRDLETVLTIGEINGVVKREKISGKFFREHFNLRF
jgi:hypothetical protein